jgi:hypothetical protein
MSALTRLYRAQVMPVDWRGRERTAFVEAVSHNCACKKIAAVIAALEHRQPADVADRIYDCHGAQELIEEGVSEDIEIRLFETASSGGKATHFVTEPLFLVDRPAALCRKWAAITQSHEDC